MQKYISAIFALALGCVQAAPLSYFGQTDTSYQSRENYGDNKVAGHYVRSDSAKIYYETYGKGKPIVILHGGIVGSIGDMGELIDQLRTDHFVIAVATRGHGKSEMGRETPSYSQKAKDVHAVLAQLNIRDAVDVIGFSDGAYTGYQFALDYPKQLHRLTAIGAGEWKKGSRQFGEIPFSTFRKLDERYWQQQEKIRPDTGKIETWYEQVNAYYNHFELTSTTLSKIQAPTLLLAGEKDQNAPLDSVLAAYRAIPNARLGIIANAPHPVLQANFAATWAMIKPFLQEKE